MRLLTDAIVFAESPRWHQGRLWFSDVHDYALKTVALDGTVTTVLEVPGRPAGIGFMPDGRLLLAVALERKLYWREPDGTLSLACDLGDLAEGPLNDMVVDGWGRAFVGDVGFDFAAGESPRPGRVICFTEADGPRVAAEGVVFPNGCAVTPDGERYYVCETLAKRVTRFTITANGELLDGELFAELTHPPDGLCLDGAGCVWVGQPEASRFVRLSANGEVIETLESAAPFAVAAVLGGESRRQLFLCSADTDLQRLGGGVSSGRIDVLDVDVPGVGWP